MRSINVGGRPSLLPFPLTREERIVTTTKLADPLNPITPEFLANPYPHFKRMREEAPVYWSEKGKQWMLTRYEDVHGVLKDMSYEKRLQRWQQVNPLVKMLPPVSSLLKSRENWMLNMDPPDHTRIRSLVNKAFTPNMVNQMRSHIKDIAHELIDKFEKKSEFDLVSDFAFPLPVTVIAEMLGVPSSDRDKFRKWSNALTSTLEPGVNLVNMNNANKANDELIEYLKPLVEERRKEPREDLISALVAAEEEGSKLTPEELLGNCILILVAGHETTVNLIGNAVRCLLENPEQLALLKSEPTLVNGAITETLRYESPVQMIRRLAGEDMEIGGTKIKEMEMVLLFNGAANRDPEMFENPDKFDIKRENAKKHLAFGHGIHHCLGSSLADAEGQESIAALFARLPNLRLKEGKTIEFRQPFALRGAKELWMVPN